MTPINKFIKGIDDCYYFTETGIWERVENNYIAVIPLYDSRKRDSFYRLKNVSIHQKQLFFAISNNSTQ